MDSNKYTQTKGRFVFIGHEVDIVYDKIDKLEEKKNNSVGNSVGNRVGNRVVCKNKPKVDIAKCNYNLDNIMSISWM